MRKVVLNLAVSLDGYIAGPNGEYDWCFADDDYGMTDFLNSIDATVMGGKSYRLIVELGQIMFLPVPKRKLRIKMWCLLPKIFLSLLNL